MPLEKPIIKPLPKPIPAVQVLEDKSGLEITTKQVVSRLEIKRKVEFLTKSRDNLQVKLDEAQAQLDMLPEEEVAEEVQSSPVEKVQ